MAEKLTIKIIRKISEVERAEWDRLLGDGSPFMKWDWLDALEGSGCVSEKSGWLPHHMIVERGGKLIGACPMYLKGHSMGEFIFDFEWADYAHQKGIRYYPKMLVGVPFTPVTGQRFLSDRDENRPELVQLMGQALARLAAENKISSIHVNFCLEEEGEALERVGYLSRSGMQFQWHNCGYQSFDDYLAAFRSDRRTKIKRERREILERGIAIRAVQGEELKAGHLSTMFELYKGHVDELYYGRQYLTREFFDELFRRFTPHLCLIFAERDSKIIAGTFNVQDNAALYGRYWGSFVEERYLHFNVCYYSAIEHCISQGLGRFEAGAGGSFKQLRGLDPEPTRSLHYIVDGGFRRVVERHLSQEREAIDRKRAALLEKSQLKNREEGNRQ